MDPDATWTRLCQALIDGDSSEAGDAAEDLAEWIAKEGAVPDALLAHYKTWGVIAPPPAVHSYAVRYGPTASPPAATFVAYCDCGWTSILRGTRGDASADGAAHARSVS